MKKVYQNYLYNLSYHLFSIIIPLVTTPYLSRVLGATGIGDYAYVSSIASYFSLFVILGLKSYGNREIAISRENREVLSLNFWNIYGMQALMGIVIVALYIGYVLLKQSQVLTLIFTISVFASVLDISWFFFGLEEFKRISIRDFAVKIITVICVFAFVKSVNDVWKYALIMSTGALVSQSLLWISVKHYVDYIRPTWKETSKHIIPNLVLFIPIVSVHLYKTMDKIMLGMISESDEVGFYYSSEKVVNVPLTIVSSLNTVMLPHMSFLYSKNKNALAYDNLRKSLSFSVLCSSWICACLICVAKDFVPIFYGPGFEKCIGLFCVLLPCGVIIAYTNVICHQYLIPNNQKKAYVIARVMGAVANMLLNALMIPCYGALGAAIATLCTEFLVFVTQMIFVRDMLIRKGVFSETYIYLLAGSASVVFLCWIPIRIGFSILNILIKCIACTLIYILILLVYYCLLRKVKKQ